MTARLDARALTVVRFVLVMAIAATGFAVRPETSTAATYDPLSVMSNDNMRDANAMSEAQIQAFLDTQAGPLKSLVTTDYAGVKRPASAIIHQAAHAWNISPRILLVTLQKEQSLIEAPTTSYSMKYRLQNAMGYGVWDRDGDGKIEDSERPHPAFGRQVYYAARALDGYGETWGTVTPVFIAGVSSKRIYDYGLKKKVTIYPKNVATWKLYTYTPYSSGPKTTVTLYARYFGSPFASPRMRSVYRFRNRSNGTYLYTASLNERLKLRTGSGPRRWDYEGYKFSWDTSVASTETVPMYRFKSLSTGKYSFTASKKTYADRTSGAGSRKWDYQGVAFRVATRPTPKAVTVYRFTNRYTGGTFLTTSANTVKSWTTVTKYKRKWRYEGVSFYLPRYSAPPTGSVDPTTTP